MILYRLKWAPNIVLVFQMFIMLVYIILSDNGCLRYLDDTRCIGPICPCAIADTLPDSNFAHCYVYNSLRLHQTRPVFLR